MKYTGLNPNGINQVASGSVAISVENIRVATFGTNTLQVTGSTILSGSLTSTGPFINNGNTVITGSLTVISGSATELQVTDLGVKIGNISTDTHTITGSLGTSGSISIVGPIVANGNLTVTGSTILSSSLSVIGSSSVTGSTILSGSLTVTGPQTVNGNLTVTGSTILSSSLSVTGTELVTGTSNTVGTLLVTGSTVMSGSVSTVGQVLALGSFSITSGSAGFDVTQSLTHTNSTASFIYGLDVAPTFTNNAPGQTQTAFRVSATFTGSFTGSSTSNIIADFGTSLSGSQFSINDINSGSIYMVTDGTGLPLIEAFSDGLVNIYDYPYPVISKSGSYVNLGNPMSNGVPSAVTIQSDLIINEGVGFSMRTSQNSGSTVGATTASLYTLNFPSGSVAYITSVVTGYDSASRQSIGGEVKATVKFSASIASVVGTNFRYINSDNPTVGFNIVAGGTSGSLEVYGTGSRTYFWAATTTTQLL